MIDIKNIIERANNDAARAYTVSVFKQGLLAAVCAIMEKSIAEKEAMVNDDYTLNYKNDKDREEKHLRWEGYSEAAAAVKLIIAEFNNNHAGENKNAA